MRVIARDLYGCKARNICFTTYGDEEKKKKGKRKESLNEGFLKTSSPSLLSQSCF